MMSGLKKKSRRTFEIFWNHMKMKRKPPKSLRHIETVLREKLLTLSAYIKNIMPLNSLEKQKQTKHKASRQKN